MKDKLGSAGWFGLGIVFMVAIVAMLLCLAALYLLGRGLSWLVYWFKRLTKGKEQADQWLNSKQIETDFVDLDGPRGVP